MGMQQEPPWVVEARKYIGQKEVPGKGNNSWVVSLFKAIKRGGIKEDSVPWCAAFVGAMLELVGLVSSRFESAKSYLEWGTKLNGPEVGCIVVFEREGGGHVGFVVGKDSQGALLVLGGNQGDEVNIRAFGRSNVRGYRWPTAYPLQATILPMESAQSSGKVV